MRIIAYIIIRLVDIFSIVLFIRCILSWIMPGQYNRLTSFFFEVTEPVVAPVRKLLYRIEFFRSIPVDFSCLATMLLLELISRILMGLFL